MSLRIATCVTAILMMFAEGSAQADACRFSIVVADHILMASSCRVYEGKAVDDLSRAETSLSKAQFERARYGLINELKDIHKVHHPEAYDLTINISKQSLGALQDKRPKAIRLSEQIPIDQMNRDQVEYFTRCMNDLGIYYHSVGLLSLSEDMFSKALQAQGQVLGKTSRNYVCTLQNLGNLRKDQGRYTDADQIFKYVLNYYAKTQGKISCEYVISLNNKAMLDLKAGRNSNMETNFAELEGLPYEKIFPGKSFEQQRIRLNKALWLRDQGKEEEAVSIMHEVKNTYEVKKHHRHPDYYDVILELGVSPLSNSRDELSLEVIEEILKNIEKDFGESSAYYARVLQLKADELIKSDQRNEALLTYIQMVNTYEKAYHKRHPDYLNALVNLSKFQLEMEFEAPAFDNLIKAMDGYMSVIRREFPSMTESEQRDLWLSLRPNIEFFQYMALEKKSVRPNLLDLAVDLEINTRGLILNNTKRVRKEILNQDDAELTLTFNRWKQLKGEVSAAYSLSEEERAEAGMDPSQLEADIDKLEKELNLRSVAFMNSFSEKAITWKDLQSGLADDEVFVLIKRLSKPGMKGSARYLALIIRSSGPVDVVELTAAEHLETKAYQDYRLGVVRRKAIVQSYNDYWLPLSGELKDVKQVYVDVDGVYNTVNIAGLRMNETNYVIDRHNINVVSSARSFIQKRNEAPSDNRHVYLYGNPDYSRNANVNDLPGTAAEVKAIKLLLDSAGIPNNVFMLKDASEESIKSLTDVGILHVASHGFFEPASRTKEPSLSVKEKLLRSRENPMLRSGLLLAGAGFPQEYRRASGEDGVLTAYEVMNLNLQQASMVVLSACETGLGDIVDGEGVYGLTRAFNVAGAQYVLASLWEVDDYTTSRLMTETYRQYIRSGNIEKSFYLAQQRIRSQRQDPSYWAAFVLIQN